MSWDVAQVVEHLSGKCEYHQNKQTKTNKQKNQENHQTPDICHPSFLVDKNSGSWKNQGPKKHGSFLRNSRQDTVIP
jgi:hypothetical protein